MDGAPVSRICDWLETSHRWLTFATELHVWECTTSSWGPSKGEWEGPISPRGEDETTLLTGRARSLILSGPPLSFPQLPFLDPQAKSPASLELEKRREIERDLSQSMRLPPPWHVRADASTRDAAGSRSDAMRPRTQSANPRPLRRSSARVGGGLSLTCAASLLAMWTILAASPACAQMVAWHMQARTPDWSSARSVALVGMLSVVLCYGIFELVRLVRRRRMHPISSRGFPLLMVQGLDALVGVELMGVAYLAYPGESARHACACTMFPRRGLI